MISCHRNRISSSVSILILYFICFYIVPLQALTARVRSRVSENGNISSLLHAQTDPEVQSASYKMSTGGFLRKNRRWSVGLATLHLPSAMAYPPWAFMASNGDTFLSVSLQLRRAKTDWSGCCQMAVQGALWLVKRYPSTLISVFVTGFRYFSYQVATQLRIYIYFRKQRETTEPIYP